MKAEKNTAYHLLDSFKKPCAFKSTELDKPCS